MLQVAVFGVAVLVDDDDGAVDVAGDGELHSLGTHRQDQRARYGGCDQFSFHW